VGRQLRCGGTFYNHVIANIPQSVQVKKNMENGSIFGHVDHKLDGVYSVACLIYGVEGTSTSILTDQELAYGGSESLTCQPPVAVARRFTEISPLSDFKR